MIKLIAEEELPNLSLFICLGRFEDRWAALLESAVFLVEKGVVSRDYPEAVIEREKRYPTGFRIGEGLAVALPHAHVKYTVKPALLAVFLENPLTFNCMGSPSGLVEVYALIFVAVKDLDRSARMLRRLGDLLAEESFSDIVKNKKIGQALELFRSLHSD